MFLNWVVGENEADKALSSTSVFKKGKQKGKLNETPYLLDEDKVCQFPERVSSGITEERIEENLDLFKQFFDEAGWTSVLALSMLQKLTI